MPSSLSASWDEPEGLAARGTLIVLAGRGEHGGVYERFGRRLAFDAYRVRALGDPAADPSVLDEAAKLLADESLPGPKVLVGSDTGALYAARLAAEQTPGIDALILAGLPTAPWTSGSWEAEVEARTACPTHRGTPHERPGLPARGTGHDPGPAGAEPGSGTGSRAGPARRRGRGQPTRPTRSAPTRGTPTYGP